MKLKKTLYGIKIHTYYKEQSYSLSVEVSSLWKYLGKLAKQEPQPCGQPHSGKAAQPSLTVTWQWGRLHGLEPWAQRASKHEFLQFYPSSYLLVWLCYSFHLILLCGSTLITILLTLWITAQESRSVLQRITISCRQALLGLDSRFSPLS